MNYDEAFDRIKNVYRTHVINLEDVVCVHNALTELSAIKQRAEEKRNDGNTLLREIELIDYILEGEEK